MRRGRGIALSLEALASHPLRTGLALAGVSAGVAAVVLLSALGTGAAEGVRRDLESLGTNLLVIRPAQVARLSARREVSGTVTTLEPEDAAAVEELGTVAAVAPAVEVPLRVKARAAAMVTKVVGTTPSFAEVRNFRVGAGRFLDDGDERTARRVAVLGARVAAALFPGGDPVGSTLRVRGVPFDVVGVLAPKGVLADGDEDNQILVPLRTGLRRVLNVRWLDVIYVGVADAGEMARAQAAIGALLRARHRRGRPGWEDDFEVQNAARPFTLQRKAADTLNLMAGGLAGLALVVGGAGILALMLMSVKERTGEIGLRMAVGARPRDVFGQFLLESTLLAMAGWAVGLVVGALGAVVVALGTRWPMGVPLAALAGSLAMALVIGLGFGAYPARRAALLPPIRALSSE